MDSQRDAMVTRGLTQLHTVSPVVRATMNDQTLHLQVPESLIVYPIIGPWYSAWSWTNINYHT
jgi:hypothetical protein